MTCHGPAPVEWRPSKKVDEWTYGYVGVVRAFTLERRGHRWLLQPHLPDMAGYPPQETFTAEAAAKARAAEILGEFLARLGLRSARPAGPVPVDRSCAIREALPVQQRGEAPEQSSAARLTPTGPAPA